MSTSPKTAFDKPAGPSGHLAQVDKTGVREQDQPSCADESASLRYELATAQQKLEHSEELLRHLLDSDSWRITKPFRAFHKKFPRLTGALREGLKTTIRSFNLRKGHERTRPIPANLISPQRDISAETEEQSLQTLHSRSKLGAFLESCPPIHGKVTFGLERDTLLFLENNVTSGSKTLETGSGMSTLLFAYKGALHTCVTPWELEVLRIKQHCAESGVSTEGLNFALGSSDEVLPSLLHSGPLDLVLIDGCHGFPIPFVDWLYCAPRLNIGGILVVDDTHLWTGAVLRDFLLSESGWKLEASFARGVAFLKVKEFRIKEWEEQPYLLRLSGQLP